MHPSVRNRGTSLWLSPRPAANTPGIRKAECTPNDPHRGRAIYGRDARLIFEGHRFCRCATHCLLHDQEWNANLDHRRASRQRRGITRSSRDPLITFLILSGLANFSSAEFSTNQPKLLPALRSSYSFTPSMSSRITPASRRTPCNASPFTPGKTAATSSSSG
jgi:hypothetical protein